MADLYLYHSINSIANSNHNFVMGMILGIKKNIFYLCLQKKL